MYRIKDHALAKADLDTKEAALPQEYKTIFNIILFSVDSTLKVILSANSLGTIFLHNYN